MSRTVPSGLVCIGHQRIVTNSTATALNTTCSPGQAFLFSVDHTTSNKHIHIRFDAVAPTTNTGICITSQLPPTFFEAVEGNKIRILGADVGTITNVAAFIRH